MKHRPKTELDAMDASHDPDAWLMAADWCEERGVDDEAARYRLMVELAQKVYPLVRRMALPSYSKHSRGEHVAITPDTFAWISPTQKSIVLSLFSKGIQLRKRYLLPIQVVMPVPFTDRFEEAGKAALHDRMDKMARAILACQELLRRKHA